MKILLSNKYYYQRGGGEIYTLGLEKLLKENGHQVAVFTMQHPLNNASAYSDYFPEEADLNKSGFKNLVKVLIRPFGSFSVRRKFTELLKTFKPDIVHLNNIHSQLSPIIAGIARRHRIPVVWTLHDHKLLCPRYDCTRNEKPCELCFSYKFNVIRYKCMKNSFSKSLVAYCEAIVWNKRILSRYTRLFLCPSSFLMKNMLKGGFKADKLKTLQNFILEEKLTTFLNMEKNSHYCYIGRLSVEKGIETLLRAAMDLPQYELRVIGTGPLEKDLKSRYNARHIIFEGFKNWDELKDILERSKFMVMPSECYENNPLSMIESLCLGTPVLGARIGGIPELINDGVNGYSFTSGDVNNLKESITLMFTKSGSFNYADIAKEARAKYDSRSYYRNLIEIYNNVLNETDVK